MNNENMKAKKEFVYVKLDRERELRYGFKAIKLLEQEYDDVPFIQLLEELSENLIKGKLSIDQVSFLVYIGLVREDKEMTREKTIELLEESDYDLPSIAELLMKIFQAFLGASPEDMKKDLSKKAASVALAMKETNSLVEGKKEDSGTGASSVKQPSGSSDGQNQENLSKRSKGTKKKRK